MIQVSIIDDQVIILNGIQKILTNAANINIANVYVDAEVMFADFEKVQPDVLLLDINMPGKNGADIASILNKKYPNIKIIVLTNVDVLIQMKQMIQKGCLGYLLKDVSPEILVEAIETVYRGKEYLHGELAIQLQNNLLLVDKKQIMTRREKEILKLIAEENTNSEIAEKLFLSLRTVENHRNNLLHKLNVKNTAGLVKVAINEGMV